MSARKISSRSLPRQRRQTAPIFAALGDETRLTLVARLCQNAPASIAKLGEGSRISRQAISRHLRVLEDAGLVQSETSGRECLFELNRAPLLVAEDYLREVSQQWDHALARLKKFVEKKD